LSHVIRKIIAREILDSRGNPTVECQLWTDKGSVIASVPSGKSIGRYEALELRDGKKRFHGMGVMKAVDNVNKIIAKNDVIEYSLNSKGKEKLSEKDSLGWWNSTLEELNEIHNNLEIKCKYIGR